MSKYLLSSAAFIIGFGIIACLGSQVFAIGDPSTATGYGCAVGFICAVGYYFSTRNTPAE